MFDALTFLSIYERRRRKKARYWKRNPYRLCIILAWMLWLLSRSREYSTNESENAHPDPKKIHLMLASGPIYCQVTDYVTEIMT